MSKINISDYKPYNGFYDLRDFKLPKWEFIRLWKVQDMLSHMSERADYFKKFLPNQWERAKDVSGCYQQILFQYPEVKK